MMERVSDVDEQELQLRGITILKKIGEIDSVALEFELCGITGLAGQKPNPCERFTGSIDLGNHLDGSKTYSLD